MDVPRRKFLHVAAGAAAFPAISSMTWAQTYPSRSRALDRPLSAGRP